MGIAVDYPIEIEGHVPGPEHVVGDPVAQLEGAMGLDEREQRRALEPGHAQQAAGGQVFQGHGDADIRLLGQHGSVEPHVLRLEAIIQFLAQTRRDLGVDFPGDDRPVIALVDREDHAQLAQVRFHRRLHVGVLQLAGETPPLVGCGAVNLAQARRRGGVLVERSIALLPFGTELGHHPALDEGPAHGRCIGLELAQLGHVFLGKGIGNRGHDLGHLHQWPLQPAERRRELGRMAVAIEPDSQIALARQARGQAADCGPNPGVAAHAARYVVVFGHAFIPTGRSALRSS